MQLNGRSRQLTCALGVFSSALVLSPFLGCGRVAADDGDGAGGSLAGSGSGGDSASGGNDDASGGSTSTGGGASGGTGGDAAYPPLEPTLDCVHPEVEADCDGDFCRIEPGCFIMGAPPGEFGKALVADDQVQVTLTRAFWIGRTEVTRAQWEASGLPIPELVQLNGERECLEPDCPQGNATPYDMFGFANRLSEMEDLEPCYLLGGTECEGSTITEDYVCPKIEINAESPYACEGYRLPTEAEWEYAARAGTATSYPTGTITTQDAPGNCHLDPALDAIGWYCDNSLDQVQRSAQKPPNAWGLYDMHGNILEVVNDLYGPSGYLVGDYVASEGPLVDPTGAVTPPDDITETMERPFRVGRGGMHNAPAANATSSRRMSGPSGNDSASNFGFRIARTIH